MFPGLGSHAVYFESGSHTYHSIVPGVVDLTDECAFGTRWDIALSLDIVFPWEISRRRSNQPAWSVDPAQGSIEYLA